MICLRSAVKRILGVEAQNLESTFENATTLSEQQKVDSGENAKNVSEQPKDLGFWR